MTSNDPDEFPFTEEQKKELERRLQKIKDDPKAGITLEEFRARQRNAGGDRPDDLSIRR